MSNIAEDINYATGIVEGEKIPSNKSNFTFDDEDSNGKLPQKNLPYNPKII
jgi:hypothetical protein